MSPPTLSDRVNVQRIQITCRGWIYIHTRSEDLNRISISRSGRHRNSVERPRVEEVKFRKVTQIHTHLTPIGLRLLKSVKEPFHSLDYYYLTELHNHRSSTNIIVVITIIINSSSTSSKAKQPLWIKQLWLQFCLKIFSAHKRIFISSSSRRSNNKSTNHDPKRMGCWSPRVARIELKCLSGRAQLRLSASPSTASSSCDPTWSAAGWPVFLRWVANAKKMSVKDRPPPLLQSRSVPLQCHRMNPLCAVQWKGHPGQVCCCCCRCWRCVKGEKQKLCLVVSLSFKFGQSWTRVPSTGAVLLSIVYDFYIIVYNHNPAAYRVIKRKYLW